MVECAIDRWDDMCDRVGIFDLNAVRVKACRRGRGPLLLKWGRGVRLAAPNTFQISQGNISHMTDQVPQHYSRNSKLEKEERKWKNSDSCVTLFYFWFCVCFYLVCPKLAVSKEAELNSRNYHQQTNFPPAPSQQFPVSAFWNFSITQKCPHVWTQGAASKLVQ